MKKTSLKRRVKNPAVTWTAYTIVVLGLVALSIFQIYRLWSQMDTGAQSKQVAGGVQPDTEASLLEPTELYVTGDGVRFGQLTTLSGSYSTLWKAAQKMLGRVEGAHTELVPDDLHNMPQTASLVCFYACPLEETAVLESLGLSMPGCRISEIRLIPASSRGEYPKLLLLDFERNRLYQTEITVGYTASVSRKLNEAFWDLAESVSPDYLNAAERYPEQFARSVFLQQKESTVLLYVPTLTVSFIGEDGTLDTDRAAAYAMHFFDHPDVAKAVETADTFIWYADEKRTVRYDASGLLQYVATQEVAEKQPVSLSEAYQLAAGFLQNDLRYDDTLLQEVYLCDYTVDSGTYTFRWNYAYNHIPFSMSEESGLVTDLAAPIEIIVEGSQVRYYHRYMLDKQMQADRAVLVNENYIEALDVLLAEHALADPIDAFYMEYAELADGLTLNWKLVSGEETLQKKVREVRA